MNTKNNTLKTTLTSLVYLLAICFNSQADESTNNNTLNLSINSFQSIALKTISKSETITPETIKHNYKNKFHGISEFQDIFKSERKKLNAKFIYMSDKETIKDTGEMTWYYVQPKSSKGRRRYHLYYGNNKVTQRMREGDLLFIGKIDDDNILVLVTEKDSYKTKQLLAQLNINDIKGKRLFWSRKNERNKKSKSHDLPKEFTQQNQQNNEKLIPVDNLELYQNPKTHKMTVVGEVTKIIDGDTIKIADVFTVRLYGIDAPEKKQICRSANNKRYRCGTQATKHLRDIIGRSKLTCIKEGRGKYGRLLFTCSKKDNGKEININAQMVYDGWAVAEYSDNYKSLEIKSKSIRSGIWNGKFVRPRDWRGNN